MPVSVQEHGPVQVGQEVRVEWTDGLVYSSKVLGCKMAAVYQVQWCLWVLLANTAVTLTACTHCTGAA